jgi:hypothetical protein
MKINQKSIQSIVAVVATFISLGAAASATAAVRFVNPDGVCGGNLPCYTTIQAAVNAASSGDTISVADATYNELVQVTKTLTLQGAGQHGVDARNRTGAEAIVGSGDGAFQIEADNVIIDGFTIQGVVNDPSHPPFTGLGAGVWMNPGFTGTQGGAQILNNIIQNNIAGIEFDNTGTIPAKVQFNLIRGNNSPGAGSGNGIETNFGLTNATIDSNKFIGQTNSSYLNATGPASTASVTISNNTLDAGIALFNASGVTITGNSSIGNTVDGTIYLGGGDSGITISSNVLNTGIEGIVIEDPYSIGPNSGVTISPNNCIAGNTTNGLRVAHLGYAGAPHSLVATNNWWGAANGPKYNGAGPGTGDNIADPDLVVNFSPFLSSRTGTPCAPPPVGPPTSADQCKKDGWQTFNTPRSFKNQGDCIQYVNTGK